MTHRPASRLALGILSSVVLFVLTGCATAPRPDVVPDPALVTVALKDGKVIVTPPTVIVMSKGTIHFVFPGSELKLFLKYPGLPNLVCQPGYCDLGPMPKVDAVTDFPYLGFVTVDGQLKFLDPMIRILPSP